MNAKERSNLRLMQLTRQDCNRWKNQRTRSPVTKRPLKRHSPTYNRIKNRCKYLRAPELSLDGFQMDFIIGKAEPDGNCFFNALVQQIIPEKPTQANIRSRKARGGHKLRKWFAANLSFAAFLRMQRKTAAKILLRDVLAANNRQDLIDVFDAVPNDDDKTARQMITQVQNLNARKQLHSYLLQTFDRMKADMKNCSIYANEYMLDHVAEKLKINIFLFDENVGADGALLGVRETNPRYKSVFMYKTADHFDPMFGENGQAMFSWREIENGVRNV